MVAFLILFPYEQEALQIEASTSQNEEQLLYPSTDNSPSHEQAVDPRETHLSVGIK